jgi:hypothetical protein
VITGISMTLARLTPMEASLWAASP